MPANQDMLVQEASEKEQFYYQPTVFHGMSFGGDDCTQLIPNENNGTNKDCAYQGQPPEDAVSPPMDCYQTAFCTPLIHNPGWVSQATVWKTGQLPFGSKVGDVGELTNVFGAAVDRNYFHPQFNHEQVLYSLIVVLGSMFILLVIAFGVIYYKGSKAHCKTD